MMTHHSVMTSSLHINNLKTDKFGNFSCDIDYSSRTDVFRDVISLIINQYDPKRPEGASVGYKVSACRAAQASEARLYIQAALGVHGLLSRGFDYSRKIFLVEFFSSRISPSTIRGFKCGIFRLACVIR